MAMKADLERMRQLLDEARKSLKVALARIEKLRAQIVKLGGTPED